MTPAKIIAALLLIAGGAALPAAAQQRDTVPRPRADTLRLGPRDTARVQPPRAPARRDTLPIRPRPRSDTLYIGGRPARPDTAAPPTTNAAADSGSIVFDTPETRALVERTIREVSVIPAGLEDYRARLFSAIYLSLRSDSASGGEVPVTVDEFSGRVEWERGGAMVQTLTGQRVRMLAPTPYTIGTLLESPWVVPHLYGSTISVFSLSATPNARTRIARAVHPFSWRGISFYRYSSRDTIRVRSQQGVTTLIGIDVRPRVQGTEEEQTVAGTFWIDADRIAIARARFGFSVREGRFLTATETGTFLELENALVQGRYWLPYRQRREIQIASPLFGGAAAIRAVSALEEFRVNTGWRPEQPGARLVRAEVPGDTTFRGFERALGELAESDISDFADLASAVRPPDPEAGPIRLSLRYERSDHLFRYNRVEGAFLGLGMRLEPRDPDNRDWDVYGTAGYAFAESTVRGELSARWHPRPSLPDAPQWTLAATGYRRLNWNQPFRPPLTWDLGYT
ncbi:MAG TPA: hypothetical protein VFR81_16045, partial [Longimicrobium sp.]|nr:hypothetical protein [Longimicrobium sp.]